MTHLCVLLVFVVVAVRDLVGDAPDLPLIRSAPPLGVILGSFLPLAGIALAVHLSMRSLGAAIDRTGARAAVSMAHTILDWSRPLIVAAHAWAVFGLGWLDLVRRAVGDVPAADEIIAITPALVAIALGWASYFPIDRRLREAAVYSALDTGADMPPLVTRAQYTLEQVRHNILFVAVPVLVMFTWWEIVQWASVRAAHRWPVVERWVAAEWPVAIVHLAGVAVLAALLPVGVKWMWRTTRLGPGPLRDRLVDLGRAHGVRFRDVLVWHTHSEIANGAVVGILPFARYVLLTDTLLQRLPPDAIEAVMAHEVGHARRWHIPWLMAAMIATISVVFDGLARVADAVAPVPQNGQPPSFIDTSTIFVIAGIACIAVFGFVSRRFELQADAFAAQHLSGYRPGRGPHPIPGGAPPISADAAGVMVAALGAVARLNHANPRKFTLRHGSIAWRQRRLANLVGHPANHLPIDGAVRILKVAILVGVAATIWMAFAGV